MISTKVGEYFEDGRSRFDFSAEATEASLANSLRQLQTDHLDMVLVHSTGEDRKIADETPVLEVLTRCRVEPGLAGAPPESRFQFLRLGYFCVDAKDSTETKPVFNRTVTLRDTWAKIAKAQNKKR